MELFKWRKNVYFLFLVFAEFQIQFLLLKPSFSGQLSLIGKPRTFRNLFSHFPFFRILSLFSSLPLSLSLSLSLSLYQAIAYYRTSSLYYHILTYTLPLYTVTITPSFYTHSHSIVLTRTHSHSLALTRTHSHSLALTEIYFLTDKLSQTYSHFYTFSVFRPTHAHTHSHPPLSCPYFIFFLPAHTQAFPPTHFFTHTLTHTFRVTQFSPHFSKSNIYFQSPF